MESVTAVGHGLAFVVGLGLVLVTFRSVIITFVLPRGSRSGITAMVFILLRFMFDGYTALLRSYKSKDAAMALYAPIGLLLNVWWILPQYLAIAGARTIAVIVNRVGEILSVLVRNSQAQWIASRLK